MFLGQTNLDLLQWFGSKKDAFGAIESILKSAGIIIGAIWAYMIFVRHREKFPRAKLEHRVQVLDYSDDEWQVRVGLSIKNESQVLLKIDCGHTWVQQIKPYPLEVVDEFKTRITDLEKAPYEARWPLLGERLHKGDQEVEPLEVHDIYMDFFVNKYYEKVLIYTFLENAAKPGRHIGWTAATVTDLKSGETTDQGQGQGTDKPRPRPSENKEKKK